MSVERAARGYPGDREILAAAFVDLLERAAGRGEFPCQVVVCCALTLLSVPPVAGTGEISLSMDGLPIGKHRLLRDHPAVVRACVQFLLRASSALPTETASASCTCRLPRKSILEQFHRPCNIRINVPFPMVLVTRNGVLDAIMMAIEPCTRQLSQQGLAHRFRRADYLEPARVRDPWPKGRPEAVESIDVAALGPKYPCDALVVILLNLLEPLPFPLRLERAITVVIPQIVLPCLANLAEKRHQSPRDYTQARECVDMLNHCCHLFQSVCIAGDDMLAVALRQHRDIYSRLMCKLRFPFDVADMDALQLDCSRQRSMFLLFVARIHTVLELDYDHKRFGASAEEIVGILIDQCRPVERQITGAEELLRTNRSCARRGCNRDYLSLRRGLYACAGCSHVFYCSRSCQKIAWRDAQSPHRDFCEDMREIVHEELAVPEHWKVATRYKRYKAWGDALTFYEGFCVGLEKRQKIEKVLMHLYECYAPADS